MDPSTLFYIGLGLLAVSVSLAIIYPRPTPFQMLVFRGLFAFSAAAIASSIPGFLKFESQIVSAGGALGVFVLIYLLNPPRLIQSGSYQSVRGRWSKQAPKTSAIPLRGDLTTDRPDTDELQQLEAWTSELASQENASRYAQKPRWMQVLGLLLLSGLLSLAAWSLRRSSGVEPSRRGVRSVAVMTLRTAPGDTATRFLAEGLPEKLGDTLATFGVQTISHSSVLGLEGSPDSITAGKELGVQAVLEGSIWRFGSKFRVHLELVDTRTGFHIWRGTFIVEGEDLFGVEDETAAKITSQLRSALIM
jgi:TolB-like protein